MTNKQEIIQEMIGDHKKLMNKLQSGIEKLEQQAILLDSIEQEEISDLYRLLKKMGKTGIDYDLFLDFQEDNILKFAREDYLLVFVPMYETELLQDIGNVGQYVSKIGNYIGFKFDKCTDPRYDFPAIIKDDVAPYLPTGFEKDFSIADGVVFFKPEDKEKVKAKYGKYLTSIQDQSATIKPKSYFDFITDLSENGYFVFDSGPYDKEFLRELDTPSKILMHEEVVVKEGSMTKTMDFTYQKEIVEILHNHRHATIGLKTGSGKSFITLAFCRKLNGKKLILVDSDIARKQWQNYIQEWTPELLEEIHVDTYQGMTKAYSSKTSNLYQLVKDTHFSLIVYDEGERAFNEEWGKSLAQKSEGRLFLTATPYPRNVKDQIIRGNFFGKMFATDWKSIMRAQQKEFAKVRVNILLNDKEKISRLIDRVVSYKDKKQIIFCQWKQKEGEITGYDLSRTISKALGRKISFIHGDTKGDRLKLLEEAIKNDGIVITTLASRSISLKELEVVHIFNPLASEVLGIQQIGRLGHGIYQKKFGEIYSSTKEISREENQDWIYNLLAKGYPVEFPDGKPKFEKKTTDIEEVAKSIVEDFEQTQIKEQSLEKVSVAAPIVLGDIEAFFSNDLVLERIAIMFNKKINQKALTMKVLSWFYEKAVWTRRELIIVTNTKKESESNISHAIKNLTNEGILLKDTTAKELTYVLNFDSVNEFMREKEREAKQEANLKRFEQKVKI